MKDFHKFLNHLIPIAKKLLVIGFFYVLPLFALGITVILLETLVLLNESIKTETDIPAPHISIPIAQYPLLTVSADISISAKAAIVLDTASKVVLYEKNPYVRFSPASTAKIMTALVGLDFYQLTDTLTIHSIDPEGVHLGFVPGQTFHFVDLLHAMLMPSSNDAANAIAENYPGGKQAFVTKMNEKAQKYLLKNTHFADPVGLEDDEDYTTVTDLSRLASIAIENPVLRSVVRKKAATIVSSNGSIALSLKNLNSLLGFYGIDGVKTGYTDGAKEVLVTSITQHDHTYIVIVMNSDDRFGDTIQLVTRVLPQITYLSMYP